LVTPKVGAKHELLFNKLASAYTPHPLAMNKPEVGLLSAYVTLK
jgi:hypothetical protein